jgi:hypothetical protein
MDVPDQQHKLARCPECGSPLVHDQRYCLECGARRGPLPAYISQVIGGIMEQGRHIIPPVPRMGEHSVDDPAWFDAWLAAPRAAAVAVMGMLAFGVMVGSLVSGAGANPLQPLLVAVSPSQPQPAGSTGSGGGAGGGGSGGGGGGGTKTITVGSTSPVSTPPSAAASGSGAGSSSSAGANSAPSTTGTHPPIKHVFLIALSGQGYNETFAHSSFDPYLAKTLAKKGEVIGSYYSVAGGSLANEIALVSGQGPTPQTLANCPVFKNVVPGLADTNGQALGTGCAYPKSTRTIADQLAAAHKTWKAYLQTNGVNTQTRAELCRPKLGSSAGSAPQPDATWRNPFLYFHTLTGKSTCPKENVSLGRLATDLKSARTTPTLSYIVPDLCHDGAATPCEPNTQSGMVAADTFLKSVVPKIEKSPAYKAGGMIAITFDQAPQTGPYADPSSCCNNPTYPNLPSSSGSASGIGTTSGTQTASTGPSSTDTTGSNPQPGCTTPGSTTGTSGSNTQTGSTTSSSTTSTAGSSSQTASTTPTTSTGTSSSNTQTGSTTSSSSTGTTGSTGPGGACPSLGTGQTKPTGGGGQVGLLLLSQYVKPGTMDVFDYFNHFSLLASIEDLFGLKRLGYASERGLPVFGSSVYTNYSG